MNLIVYVQQKYVFIYSAQVIIDTQIFKIIKNVCMLAVQEIDFIKVGVEGIISMLEL